MNNTTDTNIDKNYETWKKVMELEKAGKVEAKGVANMLSKEDITTIIATADFFGADDSDKFQIYFDLQVAKYRVFDWLAMGIQGRIQNQEAVKVLTYSFLKVGGIPSLFIEDLRLTDYEVVTDWKQIEL